MLGLSFAAVPLYDIFCRVTGFGGTTQTSKQAPPIVLDKIVSVRFDTNVNNLPWDFKAKTNVMDVKVGQVNKIEFIVENYSDQTTSGVASFNVSP
ncbi:MAG: cytochrome c oxidase assembly protein, partial [Pelagibacteraceae bacterium]